MTKKLILASILACGACSSNKPVRVSAHETPPAPASPSVGDESDRHVVGLVPQGAYVTPNGLVMIIGVQNRTSEPLMISEMVFVERASWPHPGSLGFFLREKGGSREHVTQEACALEEASVIPPGVTVFTLHQFDEKVAVEAGAMVDVTASVTLGWPFCERPDRTVRKALSLKVEDALSRRFGAAPAEVAGPSGAAGAPTTGGDAVKMVGAVYQLPGGVALLVRLSNRTSTPLRLLDASVVEGLVVGGRTIWGAETPRSEATRPVDCTNEQTVVLEAGAHHWEAIFLKGESFAPDASIEAILTARLGGAFCTGARHIVQRTLPLTLTRAKGLPSNAANRETSWRLLGDHDAF